MFNHKHYVHGKQNLSVPSHLNFGKYILDHIKLKTDEVALENSDTNDKLTYKDLTHYAVNLAVSLRKLGVGVGDTVAVGWEKRIEFIPTLVGVLFTGATYTNYDVNNGLTILKHQMLLSKPKYLITSNLFWNTYKDLLASFDCIKLIIRIDDSEDAMMSVRSLYATNENVDLFKPAEVQGQTDVALIFYSSGTTGLPKGVKLTHLNCLCCGNMIDGIDGDLVKTAFIIRDWYHSYAVFASIYCLVDGKKVVYNESENSSSFLKCIGIHKIDLAIVVPSHVELLSEPGPHEKFYLGSLKIILTAGATLHAKTIENVKKRLPTLKFIFQIYGMTENSTVTSECLGTKGLKPGSVGVPVPGRTLKVVDTKTGKILGPNQPGEICTKGPNLMKGYIGIDAHTYLDDEGFFHSGDIGYYDDDGYFFIMDRLKDIIIYDAYKIAPTALEAILQQHPKVKEAGVVGKPVPYFGEAPMAFVVTQPGSKVTEQELIDYVSVEVPPYMQLKGGVKFVDQLPRNARGKLLRKELSDIPSSKTTS